MFLLCFTVFCAGFSHLLEVSPGFGVFLFIVRRVFAVFDRLNLAALSPNLFREAIYLAFLAFARV